MKKWIVGSLAAVAVVGGGAGYYGYETVLAPNVQVPADQGKYVYVHNGDQLDDVISELQNTGALKDIDGFATTAKLWKLDGRIKSGRYQLKDGMSNRDIVRMLASGNQTPVKLTFNNKRTAQELAGRFGEVLEMDSLTALKTMEDAKLLANWGTDSLNVVGYFIPNTYEVYWNEEPAKLMERMKKEYDNFWNADRKSKLARTGLSQKEVTILASIVEEEQNQKYDEQPTIAGLYINRLKKGMKLESDPTVKFAVGDPSIRRVLNTHLAVESPYNTYKYAGLPPGPIRIPSIKAIDAVLNFKENDYIYMCAKEDFSGYHNFATNEAEHNANAARYRKALNEHKIYK